MPIERAIKAAGMARASHQEALHIQNLRVLHGVPPPSARSSKVIDDTQAHAVSGLSHLNAFTYLTMPNSVFVRLLDTDKNPAYLAHGVPRLVHSLVADITCTTDHLVRFAEPVLPTLPLVALVHGLSPEAQKTLLRAKFIRRIHDGVQAQFIANELGPIDFLFNVRFDRITSPDAARVAVINGLKVPHFRAKLAGVYSRHRGFDTTVNGDFDNFLSNLTCVPVWPRGVYTNTPLHFYVLLPGLTEDPLELASVRSSLQDFAIPGNAFGQGAGKATSVVRCSFCHDVTHSRPQCRLETEQGWDRPPTCSRCNVTSHTDATCFIQSGRGTPNPDDPYIERRRGGNGGRGRGGKWRGGRGYQG
jgi:hypothetical protein